MGVIFGVAVGVAREVGGAEVGDLGRSFGEKVGVPGRHGYQMPGESVTAAVCRPIDNVSVGCVPADWEWCVPALESLGGVCSSVSRGMWAQSEGGGSVRGRLCPQRASRA